MALRRSRGVAMAKRHVLLGGRGTAAACAGTPVRRAVCGEGWEGEAPFVWNNNWLWVKSKSYPQ